MNKIVITAAVAFAAAAASADMVQGPIIAQHDSDFSVRLVSSSAGWTGWLGYIGNTDAGPTPLLSNKGSKTASPMFVGTASAGQAVLFQYEITRGQRNTFRQDDEAGAQQFRHSWIDENTARLFVEDIKLPGGDADYNDAVFDVSFTPVPTPGTAAIGLASAGMFLRRRR